jgi:sulfur-oxidizing protein SoxX
MKSKIVGNRFKIAGVLGIALFFVGCALNEKSPLGFRLPEGSIWKGKTAFVELGCIQCHSVKGEDLMPNPDMKRDIHIELGGEVTRVKTYGQLVTSIINPSHVIKVAHREKYTNVDGDSLMPDFTDKMTVGQMIDLAEFLQARYEVVIPSHAYEEYGYFP